MSKISFACDYSELAHPRFMEALGKASHEQNATYGEDRYSLLAADLIRREIKNDKAYVHLIVGGTLANIVNIGAILKPYESVIACDTGHITRHETGSIEATGHKINAVQNKNGKLTVSDIEKVLKEHHFEHMVLPRAVYISQSTETGTIYSRAEMTAISDYCRKQGLYLYLDGARLAQAVTAKDADLDLAATAALVDMLYIGGTKNGGLLGEAVVIMNEDLKQHYRYALKQRGGLLAKGMVLGTQFVEMFKDGFYKETAAHANAMAYRLSEGLKQAGATFQAEPQTNMLLPTLPAKTVEKLEEHFTFYRWADEGQGGITIRLVTSWATKPEHVEKFIEMVASGS